jgi:helicase MOV-10
MAYSNEMFYTSELRMQVEREETHALENWDGLPRKQFPLIFHSVVGKEEREGSSTSYFNINEATEVRRYCEKLVTKSNKVGELYLA